MAEKKIRTDKAKNIAKVLKEVINNPLSSEREIAEKTGVSKSAVNRAIQEVGQIGAKDEQILEVCNIDFEIVKLGQAEISKRLGDEEELKKMRTFEIAQTIEKSEKRYMLFKGDATDEKGGMKQPDIIFQIINPYGEGEENN